MPQAQEILELDLLTLREHSERAGDPLDPVRWRQTIAASLRVSEVAAVRREGALVAYAMLQPQQAGQWFVTGFNTHPGHHNAAVLRALFQQVLAIATRRGVLSLCSHVYKTNRLSMAFHTRLGFQVRRENAKAVEFSASLADLLTKNRALAG